MTVKYDFYQTPEPGDAKKKVRYHARTVSEGTVETEKLAADIHSRCSLTEADVKATLTELSKVLAEHLSNGERVHIDGIGYFQMTLQCPPVRSAKEIRAESIRFKSVTFRPEAKLKKKLCTTTFERTKNKNHTKKYSNAEIDGKLTEFFAENEYLTRADFQQKCNCTCSAAIRHINRLLEEGKLQKKGYRNAPLYFPAPGWYNGDGR